MSFKSDITPTKVHIEGSVLLKIVKHARENSPTTIYGQNLGHQEGDVLQITNCFPLLDLDSYNTDVLALVQQSHYDAATVGLYCSTVYSEYYDLEMAQVMAQHQSLYPNSVMVVYNPVLSQAGQLSVRVVRLSENFLKMEKTNSFTADSFKEHQVTGATIFESVPFVIHNPHIIHAYLWELDATKSLDATDIILNPIPASHIVSLITELSSASTVPGTNNTHASYLEYYQTLLERYQRDTAWVARQKADYTRKTEELRVENERRQRNGLKPLNVPDAPKLNEPSIVDIQLMAQRIDAIATDLTSMTTAAQQKQIILKRFVHNADSWSRD